MKINEKLIISPEIYEKAKDFAEASVLSSADKYAQRNQNDISKIKNDILVGRIGEELAYQSLKSVFEDLSPPDYSIYDASNKSWDTDLKAGNNKFAVKTQDYKSELSYGASWVFQYNKNSNFDTDKEIFKSNINPYVIFVSLMTPRKYGMIKAIVKTQYLHDNNLFKEMKQEYLRGNKLAVYYEDLESCDSLCQI